LLSKSLILQERGISDPRDSVWTTTVPLMMERNEGYRHVRDQTRHGIALIAELFLREQSRWQQFQTDRGIDGPQRGPVSRSIFHAICRYLLGLASVATRMVQPS
jgi:hypothetical protein